MDGEVLTGSRGSRSSMGQEDNTGQSNRSSTSSIWPLPCSLSSLLTMNCRARAEGLARSVQAKIKYTGSREDMIPLNNYSSHGMDARSVSVDAAGEISYPLERPIHVVTSEPTMHILFEQKSPKNVEDDSDLHYDFGLVSPEDSSGVVLDQTEQNEQSTSGQKPMPNKNAGRWSDSQRESAEKPESGCVTSATSPVMFREAMLTSSPSSPPPPLSPTNDADLRAVREILSFTSLCGLHGMSQSIAEMSAVDSGLYTDGDRTFDSLDFFPKNIDDDSEDDIWQTCSDINSFMNRPVDLSFTVKKYDSISPPEGFRNLSFDEKKNIAPVHGPKHRRRSFDMPSKMYVQPVFRKGSPPGYRSNDLFGNEIDGRIYLTEPPPPKNTTFYNSNVKKCESEVVYSSTTGITTAIKRQLHNSCGLASTTSDSDDKHEVSKVRVKSFLHSSSHEAWPNQWQANENGGEGEPTTGTTNGTLGTSCESWHTAPTQPQLIATAESVCGQQAECYQPVLHGASCAQDEPSSILVQTSGIAASCGNGSELQHPVEQKSLNTGKMRDECESALPSFSRRRRYKVREGHAKSDGGGGASSSSDQSAAEKLSDSQAANHSEQSSEPGSPGSSKNGDNISEPSSPLNLDSSLPSAWLPAPPEENSETDKPDYIVTIPPPENWIENQAEFEKSGSNGDNGAGDEEEDVPAVVEGKFKNLYQYKEKVRKLSDADEDAYDPSITTVIQLEEADLSEPEEDLSSHDEMSQEELGAQLSRLEVEGPDLNVQAPSDESSRDSSNEPEQEDIRLRIKRSSSLKCGKTPPGTPGCVSSKKIVRFADSLGLDLAAIRTFLEGIPNVPKSAFGDLEVQQSDDDTDSHQCSPATSHSSVRPTSNFQPKRMLMPLFQQPFALPGFIHRVRDQKVVLENVSVGDDMSVRGYVRVLNIDFHKHVMVRYTFDGWRNFHEATATYVSGSCDGFSDRFSFLLWGSFLQENGSLTFCVRFCAAGSEFWDNNRGTNYVLQCYTNQVVRPPLHQQALHQPTDLHRTICSRNFGGGGSSFQSSPPTPSDTWMAGFF